MNEKIAIISDVHANLEALKSVLADIKPKKIKKIYSLGDVIGLGNSSKECLDLLIENDIKMVLGNAEEYIVLGAECFPYLNKLDGARYNNAIWTEKQLTEEQINFLKKAPHTIELNINNHKVALCHFPIDVRYDYSGVWKYAGEDIECFFNTNTSKDIRFSSPKTKNIISANNDPLFFGNTVKNYDCIIFGHYHFYRHHKSNDIEFYSLNGTGVAIDKEAIYYILEDEKGQLTISEQSIAYDYQKLYDDLDSIDYPNKKTFEKYIKRI